MNVTVCRDLFPVVCFGGNVKVSVEAAIANISKTLALDSGGEQQCESESCMVMPACYCIQKNTEIVIDFKWSGTFLA